MVGAWCRTIWLFQLGLLLLACQVEAQEEDDSMKHGMSEESDEEMDLGPIPACFETDMAYIGYPMNNSESQDRFFEGCPNSRHCQMMCQEDKDCHWFNWSNFTSPRTGKATTKCWFKTGKGNPKAMPGVITGPKYCEPHTHRHCIENGRMYIGDGLNVWKRRRNNFGRQKTAARCQDLCKRTQGCKWFNWNRKSECWLKRSHGQRITTNVRLEPGVSTGPRECRKIPAGQSCDKGWEYFEGNCYMVNLRLDNATLNFVDVTKLCMDLQAHLVSFQSRKEFDFVTDILDRNHFQQKGVDFWVGAKRPSDGEGYQWQEDVTAVEVFNWAEGEPEAGNKCLQLFKDESGTWVYASEGCKDEDDDGSFICEKPANITSNDEEATENENDAETTESGLEVADEVTAVEEETQPTTLKTEGETAQEQAEDTTLSDDTTQSEDTTASGPQSDDVAIATCTTPVIENGMMECNDDFECLLTCSDGYSPFPHSLYGCSDGLWEKAAHSGHLSVEDIKCSPAKVVIGGCSILTNETIIQISDSTETCRIPPLPPLPGSNNTCHTGYTLDFVDGTLMACGGAQDPNKCLKFHYSTKTWEDAAQLNVPRVDSSSVVIGSRIYIIGGESAPNIETVKFNSFEDSFESTLDPNLITYDVAGDCMVPISSNTILTLTVDNFFSYNVSSGLADDLELPSPMDLKSTRVPCTTYTAMDGSGNMKRMLMVTNGVGTAADKVDQDKLGFIYDIESETWVNTADTLTSYAGGQLLNIEGGDLVLINPKAEDSEGRTFRFNLQNPEWEEYGTKMNLTQSTINGPATTVPSDLFTCERFGLA